jgi:hypothetical protein
MKKTVEQTEFRVMLGDEERKISTNKTVKEGVCKMLM